MKIESGKDKMLTLVGKEVSPGLAKGKAFVYIDVLQRDSELYVIDRAQIGEEKARIEKAIDDVRQSLHIDAKQIEGKLGKQSGDIFLAQEAILLDSFVVGEMKKILETELINAEQVVRTVFTMNSAPGPSITPAIYRLGVELKLLQQSIPNRRRRP